MDKTFELKKGKLVFEEDKIVISDNAKYERRYRIFSYSVLLLFGLSFLVKYVKTGEMLSLRFGLLMGAAGLLNFAYEFFKSVQSEIFLKEVKSFKMNRVFFRDVLYIKLTNNKTRQVSGIFNTERLEEYFETIHFNNKSK